MRRSGDRSLGIRNTAVVVAVFRCALSTGAQQALPTPAPAVVEVYRDSLRSGASLGDYRKHADSAAGLCRTWICPHPYLGVETLSGNPEVWFLNFFPSWDDTSRVKSLYAAKPELSQRLGRAVASNSALVVGSNVFVQLEQTSATRWALLGSRFVIVARPGSRTIVSSAFYRAPAGASFSFIFVRTRHAADSAAKSIGPSARVFAIRPHWSQPDPSWLRADPAFWGEWPSALPTGNP